MADGEWTPDPRGERTDTLNEAPQLPRVPGFRLLRRLGRGGMAVVYEAEHELLARRVALKLLRPGIDAEPEIMERFLREARAVAAVTHPRVMAVHEVGYAAGQMFMALELCTGGSLKDLVSRGGPLGEDRTLEMMADVCDGLAAIHRADLVHRDIKPANILIAGDGSLRVGDLGLAYRRGDEHMTATGCQVGTPAYMPPEQIAGNVELDARTDLYAVGGTMFSLLTGKPPFKGGTDFVISHRVLAGEVPDLAAHAAVRPATAAVFRCLMAPNRDDRYRHAADLAADLRRIRAGHPPEHLPGGGRPSAQPRRPSSLVVAAAGAAILAAGAVGWLVLGHASATGPAPIAQTPPGRQRAIPSADPPATGRSETVWRTRLARLDDPAPLRLEMSQGLERDLAQLAELHPGATDVGRWRARLDAERSRTGELRQHLAALDRPDAVAAEDLPRLSSELAEYQLRVPATDQSAARWGEAVRSIIAARSAREAETAAALAHLAVLDGPSSPGLAILDGLEPDLEALGRNGRAGDAARLRDRIAACRASIAATAARLARLDDATPPSRQVLDALRADLTAFAGLARPGDPAPARWAGRIAILDSRRLDLAARLSALDRSAPPQPDAGADLAAYTALAGADDPDAVRWQSRLAAIAAARDRLRAAAPSDRSGAAADLERLVGRDDPDVAGAITARPAPAPIEPAPARPAWAAAAGSDAAGRWAEARVGGATIRLRLVHPQSFSMGPGPQPADRAHDVTITRPVWLAETECTQGLWRAVTGEAGPGSPRGPAQPVTDITWHEAVAFLAALRKAAPGLPARLPSEAEWELAARSGGGNAQWTKEDAGGAPHPVAQGPADRIGLHDLLGNVWEWCADAWQPYPERPVTDPLPADGDRRVIRGGGYASPAGAAAPTMRASQPAGNRQPFIGFRIAVDGG